MHISVTIRFKLILYELKKLSCLSVLLFFHSIIVWFKNQHFYLKT
jgi:hypothetical protein